MPETNRSWVKLPNISGLPSADASLVRLVKSLYYLRQAPKFWYEALRRSLSEIGFRRSQFADCLAIGGTMSSPIQILAFVVEVLVIGSKSDVSGTKAKIGK